jgi:hypothetical protein
MIPEAFELKHITSFKLADVDSSDRAVRGISGHIPVGKSHSGIISRLNDSQNGQVPRKTRTFAAWANVHPGKMKLTWSVRFGNSIASLVSHNFSAIGFIRNSPI